MTKEEDVAEEKKVGKVGEVMSMKEVGEEGVKV